MVKTMKKEDVLVRAKLDKFNVNCVKEHASKAAPSVVVTALKDLKRDKKAGKVKDPEVKLGLIEGHLFIRIKDGKKYLDDFLIKKNFEAAPDDGDDAPVKDRAYMQKVKQYRDIRMEAFDQLIAGEKSIKRQLGELEDMLYRVQQIAEEAKAGNFGYSNPGDKAQTVLKDAIAKTKDMKSFFDAEVHAPFSEHRNYKKPDGVATEDVDEWGRSFYLSQWRPKYGKAVEYLKLAQTVVGQIRVAAKNAVNFTERSDNTVQNYRSYAQELAALVKAEVTDAGKVWGLQAPDEVTRAVTEDKDKLVGLRSQEKLGAADLEALTTRYLNTASERMVALANGFKRLQKHVEKQNEIAARLKTIPKSELKDKEIKNSIADIKKSVSDMKSYHKEVSGYVKSASSAFKEIKKEATAV